MITEQQLKEWEEIEKKITPGPWFGKPNRHHNFVWDLLHREDLGFLNLLEDPKKEDVEFFVMARTAIPLLIEEVKTLRKILYESRKPVMEVK